MKSDSVDHKMATTELGSTGISVSKVGLGTYRMSVEDPQHRLAMRRALLSGVNLIDTSSNYMDGASEQLIGGVIKELMASDDVNRSDLCVVTKAGYIQGQTFDRVRNEAGAFRFEDVVQFDDQLCHCMDPQFLENELTASLERLQLDYVDVFLIHNPEYYLTWARDNNMALDDAQDEFYQRIERAFSYLEQEVEKGRIRYYGISSNTFPVSQNQFDFVSLERVWRIANSISDDHHFRVIQFPMNLLEIQAVVLPNQDDGKTLLEAAQAYRLGVLINRPLNAMQSNQHMLRLAHLDYKVQRSHQAVADILNELAAHETQLMAYILPKLTGDIQAKIQQLFSFGQSLVSHWSTIAGYLSWQDIVMHYLIPSVESGVQFLHQQFPDDDSLKELIQQYLQAVNMATFALSDYFKAQNNDGVMAVIQRLGELVHNWPQKLTPSQSAICSLAATPGVSCVLVGMRQERYVDDGVNAISDSGNFEMTWELWEKFRS